MLARFGNPYLSVKCLRECAVVVSVAIQLLVEHTQNILHKRGIEAKIDNARNAEQHIELKDLFGMSPEELAQVLPSRLPTISALPLTSGLRYMTIPSV